MLGWAVVPAVLSVGLLPAASAEAVSAPVGAGVAPSDTSTVSVNLVSIDPTQPAPESGVGCQTPQANIFFGYDDNDNLMATQWYGEMQCGGMTHTSVYAYEVHNGVIVDRAAVDVCPSSTDPGPPCSGGESDGASEFTSWQGQWYAVVDTVAVLPSGSAWAPPHNGNGLSCTVSTTNHTNDTLTCRSQSGVANLQ
jgi:hypothetical protein